MALRDWVTPKQVLVEELSDMYSQMENTSLPDKEWNMGYWGKHSKPAIIGQIEHLMYTTGKNWCYKHGWTDEPCDC